MKMHGKSIQKSAQEAMAKHGFDTEVTVTQRLPERAKILKVPLKEIVGQHFYLDYLENEESTRYGCFVFEIV